MENQVIAPVSIADQLAQAGIDRSALKKVPKDELDTSSDKTAAPPESAPAAIAPPPATEGRKKHRRNNAKANHGGVVGDAKAVKAKGDEAPTVATEGKSIVEPAVVVYKLVPRQLDKIHLRLIMNDAPKGVVWQLVLHAPDSSVVVFSAKVKRENDDVYFSVLSSSGPASEVFKPETPTELPTVVYQSEVYRLKTPTEARKAATASFRKIVDGVLKLEKERTREALSRSAVEVKQQAAPAKPTNAARVNDKPTAKSGRKSHRNRRLREEVSKSASTSVVTTPPQAIEAEVPAEATAAEVVVATTCTEAEKPAAGAAVQMAELAPDVEPLSGLA